LHYLQKRFLRQSRNMWPHGERVFIRKLPGHIYWDCCEPRRPFFGLSMPTLLQLELLEDWILAGFEAFRPCRSYPSATLERTVQIIRRRIHTWGIVKQRIRKGDQPLSLSVGFPAQADIQNSLDKGFVGNACAFRGLGQVFAIS
jgi:hypothetical protein